MKILIDWIRLLHSARPPERIRTPILRLAVQGLRLDPCAGQKRRYGPMRANAGLRLVEGEGAR